MAKAKDKARTNFVALYASDFLSDQEYQAMTAEERGVFMHLILSLYANEGKLSYDLNMLCKMCNTNCEVVKHIVSMKFQVCRKKITHKRVTQELEKAQGRVNSAVKASNTRWKKSCDRNATA